MLPILISTLFNVRGDMRADSIGGGRRAFHLSQRMQNSTGEFNSCVVFILSLLIAVNMQLNGCWEKTAPYPLVVAEAQGGIVGRDRIVISGFINNYSAATPATYAINLDDPDSQWRQMDDMPVSEGITHAAVAIFGTKVYMCGG